jgi:zinc protease
MKKVLKLMIIMTLIVQVVVAQKLPSNFHFSKLKNGLDVLVIEDKTVPLITVEICVKN